MRLLAFGGPLNEQMVEVEGTSGVVYAALPVPLAQWTAEASDAILPRKATYTVEKVGFHFADRCIDPNIGLHSDTCRWTALCLVVNGYPKHRITDGLNAVLGLCRMGVA